jgi:DNA repair exonuclease SbcCD ATPase subunit
LKTQQQLSYNISGIASMALETVFDTPYELHLEFVERRSKTECDIYFIRDKVKIDPFSGGGGAIDVASFALRIALWSMQQPKTRPTLILDEPFKHLKGEVTNRKVLEMVNKISKKLNIQIIMVSDERVSREITSEFTDKLFETSIVDGVTQIQEI